MKHKEINIDSFDNFIKYVSHYSNEKRIRLFRGQKDDKPLNSKLYRLVNKNSRLNEFYEIEKNIISEFKKLAYLHSNITNEFNDWEILSIAQHFGLPTRLLDWSSNPLVALWFAFENEKKDDKKRIVWGLVVDNNYLVDIEKDIPFKQRFFKVFKPKYIDPRINAQNSWFSIQNINIFENNGGDGLPLINQNESMDESEEFEYSLVKLIIPNSERIKILRKLDLLGINHFSLFPGLEGLCKTIEWKEFKNK